MHEYWRKICIYGVKNVFINEETSINFIRRHESLWIIDNIN